MKHCIECGRKHLSAALAYAGGMRFQDMPYLLHDETVVTLLSRAWVLAAESVTYPEHLPMAIGMVVRAEELALVSLGDVADELVRRIRSVRIGGTASDIMRRLSTMPECIPFVGHIEEAISEGGAVLPDYVTPEWFAQNFEAVVKTLGSGGPLEEKGGDSDMACGKKAACKGGKAKATKAACKGGSCKKGGKKCCK